MRGLALADVQIQPHPLVQLLLLGVLAEDGFEQVDGLPIVVALQRLEAALVGATASTDVERRPAPMGWSAGRRAGRLAVVGPAASDVGRTRADVAMARASAGRRRLPPGPWHLSWRLSLDLCGRSFAMVPAPERAKAVKGRYGNRTNFGLVKDRLFLAASSRA